MSQVDFETVLSEIGFNKLNNLYDYQEAGILWAHRLLQNLLQELYGEQDTSRVTFEEFREEYLYQFNKELEND